MKISRKDLEKLISEVMAEQRVPGEATARSEQAYRRNSPSGTRRPAGKGLSTARRRRDRDEINWALKDADGDGDLDLVNIAGKGLTASGEKAETGDVLIAAGILDSEAWSALSSDEHFEDPKFGRKTRRGNLENFMTDLAYDIASGKEQRLTLDQIRKLADLNPEWAQALDQFDADVADEMRRQEFMQENLNESKETQMSKGFGRSDIKSWFAQTLYEDFETSKPRKRRSTGILTEVEDHSPTSLSEDDRNRLAQAIVTGINLEFDINASGPALVELEEQIQYHLAKRPELPAILFEIAMDAVGDGMAASDVAGSDLAAIINLIAIEIADTMDAADLVAMPKSELDEIIRLMIRQGDLDPMAASANIDADDLHGRVQEIQGESEVLHLVASEVYNTMDSTSLRRDDLKRLIDDMIAAGRFTRKRLTLLVLIS